MSLLAFFLAVGLGAIVIAAMVLWDDWQVRRYKARRMAELSRER